MKVAGRGFPVERGEELLLAGDLVAGPGEESGEVGEIHIGRDILMTRAGEDLRAGEALMMEIGPERACGLAWVEVFVAGPVVDGQHGTRTPVGRESGKPRVPGFVDLDDLPGIPIPFEDAGGGEFVNRLPDDGIRQDVSLGPAFVSAAELTDREGIEKLVRVNAGASLAGGQGGGDIGVPADARAKALALDFPERDGAFHEVQPDPRPPWQGLQDPGGESAIAGSEFDEVAAAAAAELVACP